MGSPNCAPGIEKAARLSLTLIRNRLAHPHARGEDEQCPESEIHWHMVPLSQTLGQRNYRGRVTVKVLPSPDWLASATSP